MCRICSNGSLFRSIQFLIAASLIVLIQNNLFAKEKYKLICNQQLLEESRKILVKQIGITEKTNNNDGDVEKYLKSVNLTKGMPYCAAGQYWCFEEARKLLGNNLINPLPKTGLANLIFNYAKKIGIASIYIAEIDDLIVWRKDNTAFGHIERVIKTGKAGWVETIAFNIKIPNSNKQGVYQVKRNLYYPLSRMRIRGIVGFIKE